VGEVSGKAAERDIRDGYSLMERMAPGTRDGGIMITTVGHVDLILSIPVGLVSTSKNQKITRRRQQQLTSWVDRLATCTFEPEEVGGMTI
jgi:hypothetical protein